MEYKPIEGVKVVGIGHRARQGKDTIANYLVEKYGAQKFAFADALYDIARADYGMTEKNPPLLQWLGTDKYRAKDPETWVRVMYWKLKDKRPKLAVIADCRFENEASLIKDLGGYLIKVCRFNSDNTPYIAQDRPADHPSEVALDSYGDFDSIIHAKDGDFQSLYKGASQFAQAYNLIQYSL